MSVFTDTETSDLLDRCGALARGIGEADRQAAALRDRRLAVWKELLGRGVKAGDIATADGTLSKEAVRDAIRKDRTRAEAEARRAARSA